MNMAMETSLGWKPFTPSYSGAQPAIVALAVAVLMISFGCGDDTSEPASGPDAGTLHILQVWDESSGLYAEGAVSYIAVETVGGDQVVESELDETPKGAEFSVRLNPGAYMLRSWQRPCEGSCESLDPVTDLCSSEEFSVEPRAAIEARIEVQAGSGCSMAFSTGPD